MRSVMSAALTERYVFLVLLYEYEHDENARVDLHN